MTEARKKILCAAPDFFSDHFCRLIGGNADIAAAHSTEEVNRYLENHKPDIVIYSLDIPAKRRLTKGTGETIKDESYANAVIVERLLGQGVTVVVKEDDNAFGIPHRAPTMHHGGILKWTYEQLGILPKRNDGLDR